jgi:CO/xanthine dehydrogenase FAD-binding subunit
VCGSIAHADPSAELPLVLCALGGEVHLRSAKRRRRVPVGDFFAGMMATCACRKLNPAILVMQSAQDWTTRNVPAAIDGARDRCIFLQG